LGIVGDADGSGLAFDFDPLMVLGEKAGHFEAPR
jgi:hypothetical protein